MDVNRVLLAIYQQFINKLIGIVFKLVSYDYYWFGTSYFYLFNSIVVCKWIQIWIDIWNWSFERSNKKKPKKFGFRNRWVIMSTYLFVLIAVRPFISGSRVPAQQFCCFKPLMWQRYIWPTTIEWLKIVPLLICV